MDEMSKNMSFDYPEKPKFREGECGHVYFKEGIDESTEQFSKNVKLEARTEYTSHVNGKIGEGGSNVYFVNLIADPPGSINVTTTASFEDAKTCYQSGGIVLFGVDGSMLGWAMLYFSATEYSNNYENTGKEAIVARSSLSENAINYAFLSDNSVVVS